LLAGRPVGLHEALQQVDQFFESLDLADRSEGVDSMEETDLRLVDVSRPGHDPLIDQGGANLTFGLGTEPAYDLGVVPIRTEDVGTEMPE
jgi:hypothetical protein